MAPKRSTPLEVPPSASSTSDEEESGSSGEEEEPEKPGGEAQEEEEEEEEDDEEEDDEEEEEEDAVAARGPEERTQKPLPSSGSKPTPAKSESESETESESESDPKPKPERPKAVAKPNVKPISSKPIDPRPKGKAVAAVTGKRSAEVDEKDGKEAKRSKKEGEANEKSEDVKKQLFQRLWSEEDEVAVLEGLVKKGVDAVKDMASFHEFIRKDLHIDVSLTQLKDKVTRVKKKFDNNRKGKMGEEKTFNKSHDQKVFDLSKRIWGSEVSVSPNGDSAAPLKSNGKAKSKVNAVDGGGSNSKVENLGGQKINFDRSNGMEEFVMRKGAELLQGTKKSEMDEKLRQLHVEELELFLKRNKLVREYTEVVLAAYKTNDDE